jgi:hypothetical protein
MCWIPSPLPNTRRYQSTVDICSVQSCVARLWQAVPTVQTISADAPILFAKACELFILELTLRAWFQTDDNKRRTLQVNLTRPHMRRASQRSSTATGSRRQCRPQLLDHSSSPLCTQPRAVGASHARSYARPRPALLGCLLIARTRQRTDVATAITRTEMFDFLVDILPIEEIHHIRQVRVTEVNPARLNPTPCSCHVCACSPLAAHPHGSTHIPLPVTTDA